MHRKYLINILGLQKNIHLMASPFKGTVQRYPTDRYNTENCVLGLQLTKLSAFSFFDYSISVFYLLTNFHIKYYNL
jgi:hypothetical protein